MSKPVISERGFWEGRVKREHCFDKLLAKELSSFFRRKTVIDLGCGLGKYVKLLNNNGVTCKGWDGHPATKDYPDCDVADLSNEVNLGMFDWVLSLEVGEHIPAQYESIYLTNLHCHNREGIVLSWAVVNQGGFGHVNCRNNDYVKEKFEQLGYKNDVDAETRLREASTLQWFKKTIMVFVR